MIISFKTGKPIEKKRFDKRGRPITRPEVLAELERIEAKPYKLRPPKENIRLAALRRDGDSVKNKNKLRRVEQKAPDQTTLAELNNNPATPADTLGAAKAIINDVYSGMLPISAIRNNGLTPRKFYTFLEKSENAALRASYFSARECLAEFALYKRELLEKQLLAGEIDSSTYAALANDYKYLAAKCYPKLYGDKLTIDSNTTTTVNHTIDASKVLQLNQMLNGGALPAPAVVDAEFEER